MVNKENFNSGLKLIKHNWKMLKNILITKKYIFVLFINYFLYGIFQDDL